MEKFKLIDHSADIGIQINGKTLNELFSNAAEAMFGIISGSKKIGTGQAYEIELKEPSIEELMHAWLSELLYRFSAQEILFSKFNVEVDEKKLVLKAKVEGEFFNAREVHIKAEIKGVTYYQLKIERSNDKAGNPVYGTRIIFDV